MKTIFEGIVNGEKFNNVEEYNQRISELMSAGETVDATTSTHMIEDQEDRDESDEPDEPEEMEFVRAVLFPFIDENGRVRLAGEKDDPVKMKKDVCAKFNDIWPKIYQRLNGTSTKALETLYDEYEKITNNLTKELQNYELIDTYRQIYVSMMDRVDKILTLREIQNPTPTEQPQSEDDDKNRLKEAIGVLENIFGKENVRASMKLLNDVFNE